jgi:hypothetical protein
MNTQAQMQGHPSTSSASPIDRASPLSQAKIVGAVSMALAGFFLLATLVLALSVWIPAWTATLGVSTVLTALSLAAFASADPGSRLRSFDFQSHSTAPTLRESEPASDQAPTEYTGPVADVLPVRAIEEHEYEEATMLDDEQETTAVRHVAALLNTQRPMKASVRATDPMFPRSTRSSIAGG